MPHQLTFEELAALMKKSAGLTVDPQQMADHPEVLFAEFGLDSLGLLGIVGELENTLGTPLPQEADKCASPHAFLELVNDNLMTGA
jgi:minimal PKS acyl carrier protein